MKYKLTKKITPVVFGIYILIILRLTVFRNGFSPSNMLVNGRMYAIPFVGLIRLFQHTSLGNFAVQFWGNIFCFMPFGIILPMLIKRETTVGKMVMYGFLFSLFIETMQFVFGTGISEVDDLILNTLGIYLGCQSHYLGKKRFHQDSPV